MRNGSLGLPASARPVLDRAARATSEERADELAAVWFSDGSDIDREGVIGQLNALFPCPY